MLVLSRRQGQAIVIGDNVIVRIVELKGDQVRLGIDAPRSVIVHREEVAEEIRQENLAAGAAASVDLSALPLPGVAKPSAAGARDDAPGT